VFWGRPTQKVKDLIERVQQELSTIAPSVYSEAMYAIPIANIDRSVAHAS
jgi:hypothetical protein